MPNHTVSSFLINYIRIDLKPNFIHFLFKSNHIIFMLFDGSFSIFMTIKVTSVYSLLSFTKLIDTIDMIRLVV